MDIADLLECSICLEQLSHLNKVLPCQHTFCTQCLKDIFQKKQKLECPECRKEVSVPIDSLPPNILANRILESMGQQARKSSQSNITVPTTTMSQKPAILTTTQYDPPVLPVPKKPPNNIFNHDDFTKQVRAPIVSHQIMSPTSVGHNDKFTVSPNTSPIKQSVIPSTMMSSSIPGNPQTNPFLQLIDATPFYEQRKDNLSTSFSKLNMQPERRGDMSSDHLSISSIPAPTVPPPRPPSSLSSSPGPPLPDRNKPKASSSSVVDGRKSAVTQVVSPVPDSTKQWQLSPRAFLDPPAPVTTSSSSSASSILSTFTSGATSSSSSVASQQIYKAQFEYKATQKDELSLRKGELYQVMEKCHDGWFKGKNMKTGKSGVFPGNYVKEYSGRQTKKSRRKELVSVGDGNLIDLSDEDERQVKHEGDTETDADRLKKLKAIRETLRQAQQQQRQQSGACKNKGEKYRCVVPFPASSEFEIDLSLGDVVTLVKRRDDGWCKGTHHRTGKTGLFPASFVEKI